MRICPHCTEVSKLSSHVTTEGLVSCPHCHLDFDPKLNPLDNLKDCVDQEVQRASRQEKSRQWMPLFRLRIFLAVLTRGTYRMCPFCGGHAPPRRYYGGVPHLEDGSGHSCPRCGIEFDAYGGPGSLPMMWHYGPSYLPWVIFTWVCLAMVLPVFILSWFYSWAILEYSIYLALLAAFIIWMCCLSARG